MSIIDNMLRELEAPQRTELERVRRIIHAMAPEATEVMTYGMPGFKYQGKYLISFAAFKDHLSVFPGAEPIEVLKDKLKDYKLSKGTVQFTLEHPLPEELIKALVQVRMEAIKG